MLSKQTTNSEWTYGAKEVYFSGSVGLYGINYMIIWHRKSELALQYRWIKITWLAYIPLSIVVTTHKDSVVDTDNVIAKVSSS